MLGLRQSHGALDAGLLWKAYQLRRNARLHRKSEITMQYSIVIRHYNSASHLRDPQSLAGSPADGPGK